MNLGQIAQACVPRWRKEGRLVRLPEDRTIVFVGDTHGDLDATKRVFATYPPSNHTLVFLGDAVDRGPDSAGNLTLILETKLRYPKAVHLLMGNHEAWAAASFSPADFWERLDGREVECLSESLLHLPLAAHHPAGVLAVHGAIPDLPTLRSIEDVAVGSAAWRAITWGDLHEKEAHETSIAWGRPSFSRTAFDERANRLGVRVLVRSHQPFSPTYMFDDRCLTIFSSSAYGDGPRRIALLHPGTSLQSARDLVLEEI